MILGALKDTSSNKEMTFLGFQKCYMHQIRWKEHFPNEYECKWIKTKITFVIATNTIALVVSR